MKKPRNQNQTQTQTHHYPPRKQATATETTTTTTTEAGSNWWRFWKENNTPTTPTPTTQTQTTTSSESESESNSTHSATTTNQTTQTQTQPSEFTLITPNLTTRPETNQEELPAYDSFTASDITPALQRLLAFWNANIQEHSLTADLGIGIIQPNQSQPNQNINNNNTNTSNTNTNTDQKPTDETDLGQPINNQRPTLSVVTRSTSYLPKLRKQPLSPAHKLLFKHDGRLVLLKETNSINSSTQSTPIKTSPTGIQSPSTPFNSSPITAAATTIQNLQGLLQRAETSTSHPDQPGLDGPIPNPQPSAWWLDITCPTSSDMHQLGKIFPLHPLTIEDILHQDTREKTETFHGLGYYLVCFRGLDPSSFDHKDDDSSSESDHESSTQYDKELHIHRTISGCANSIKNRTITSSQAAVRSSVLIRRRRKKKNIETRKKNVKRIFRVFENQPDPPLQYELKHHHLDDALHNSSHRTDHLHRSSSQSDPPLTPPTGSPELEHPSPAPFHPPGLRAVNLYLVVFRDGIISFHFENFQKHIDRVKERMQSFSSETGHVSPHWIAYGLMDSIVDEFFPVLEFIEDEADEIEEYLLAPLGGSSGGGKGRSEKGSSKRRRGRGEYNDKLKSLSMIDRSKMLNRITLNRKLVVSMARLLAHKFQPVQALRKRMIDDHLPPPLAHLEHQSNEIGLYLGDLQDHILSISQALTFYDAILSSAHLTYLGVLRVGLDSTKQAQDMMIIRLYLITLIVLPMNMLIGLHSMNIRIPSNGAQDTHLEPDGSPAPFNVFFIILSACALIGVSFVYFIRKVIIAQSQRRFKRSFPKLFFFL